MISSVIVILVFAVIGWSIFKGIKAPKKWWAWMLVLLVVIAASYVGTNSILFGFPGFEIHLNDCLQGLGFGAIAGFVIKK